MLSKKNLWALPAMLLLAGCSDTSAPTETPAASTTPAPAAATTAKPEEDPAKAPLSADEVANIKKLSDEADQKAAEAQKVCPMTGEHLGSMGMPVKVTAEGQTAFLCCSGCKADFEADPTAALAKLKK